MYTSKLHSKQLYVTCLSQEFVVSQSVKIIHHNAQTHCVAISEHSGNIDVKTLLPSWEPRLLYDLGAELLLVIVDFRYGV